MTNDAERHERAALAAWLAEGPGWGRVFIEKEAAEKLAAQGGTLKPLYTHPPASVQEPVAVKALDTIAASLNRHIESAEAEFGECSYLNWIKRDLSDIRALSTSQSGPAPEIAAKEPDPIRNMDPGIYTCYWRDGGSSKVAIGMGQDGTRWFAPTNWIAPALRLTNEHANNIDCLIPIGANYRRLREKLASLLQSEALNNGDDSNAGTDT